MYYTKTFIKTHCPQRLHIIVCSIITLTKKPSCSSPCTQTPSKTHCPPNCVQSQDNKKKKSIMLEPVHPNFPQQCIQSQDNKKRPCAGGHAPRLSMEQSFQTQDNKRKHHAPAHAFFINQIFLLSYKLPYSINQIFLLFVQRLSLWITILKSFTLISVNSFFVNHYLWIMHINLYKDFPCESSFLSHAH
jgi:hypothetical protein